MVATVRAKTSPLNEQTYECVIPDGTSLGSLLSADGSYFVLVNGDPVENWAEYSARAGDQIAIVGVPGAPAIPFIVAAFKVVAVAAALYSLYTVLTFEMPEVDQLEPGDRLNSLTGSKNRFSPYANVPIIYGERLIYPPMAAQPYTEILGGQQYLNMLFVVGIGQYEINASDVRIGENPLTNFDYAQLGDYYTGDGPIPWELATDNNVGIELDDPYAPSPNTTHTAASDPDAVYLAIDLTFPVGLIYTNANADRESLYIEFKVEYEDQSNPGTWLNVRDTDWLDATLGTNSILGTTGTAQKTHDGPLYVAAHADHFRVKNRVIDAFRVGLKWPVPSGQYNIRVTRILMAAQNDGQFVPGKELVRFQQMMIWTRLHTYSDKPAITLPSSVDATFLRLRIRATDQLNGTLEDFSCIAKRRLRYWNGTAFAGPILTSSPAWAYLDMLVNPAVNHKAYGEASAAQYVDLDAIRSWHLGEITSEPLRYDDVIDFNSSIYKGLKRVAGVGWAGPSFDAGKWSVRRDDSVGTAVQLFTPRNSWAFKGQKRFQKNPHALKVTFDSIEAGNKPDQLVVYDDGYSSANASLFQGVKFPGVVVAAQAWKHARRLIAERRLRPEIFTFKADIAHIVCQRGDAIKRQDDVALFGLGSGRVVAVDINTPTASEARITIDERLLTEAGEIYELVNRRTDTADTASAIVTATATPVLLDDWNTQWDIAQADETKFAAGDLVAVGKVLPGAVRDLKVLDIKPSADQSATITAVDNNAGIYTAHTGPIPPYSPGVTQPLHPSTVRPTAPVIEGVYGNENMAVILDDGSRLMSVGVSYTIGSKDQWASLVALVAVREKAESGDTQAADWQYPWTGQPGNGTATVKNLRAGETYEFKMLLLNEAITLRSEWSNIVEFTVPAKTFAPEAPDNLTLTQISRGVQVLVDTGTAEDPSIRTLRIAYNTVNDRSDLDGPTSPTILDIDSSGDNLLISGTDSLMVSAASTSQTKIRRIAVPGKPSDLGEIISDFVFFDFNTPVYFWVQYIDLYGNESAWYPSSPTAGLQEFPGGTKSFYIFHSSAADHPPPAPTGSGTSDGWHSNRAPYDNWIAVKSAVAVSDNEPWSAPILTGVFDPGFVHDPECLSDDGWILPASGITHDASAGFESDGAFVVDATTFQLLTPERRQGPDVFDKPIPEDGGTFRIEVRYRFTGTLGTGAKIIGYIEGYNATETGTGSTLGADLTDFSGDTAGKWYTRGGNQTFTGVPAGDGPWYMRFQLGVSCGSGASGAEIEIDAFRIYRVL